MNLELQKFFFKAIIKIKTFTKRKTKFTTNRHLLAYILKGVLKGGKILDISYEVQENNVIKENVKHTD